MAEGVSASMFGSGAGAGAVNIGNYKGVMLCNRPFNGVSSSKFATLYLVDKMFS